MESDITTFKAVKRPDGIAMSLTILAFYILFHFINLKFEFVKINTLLDGLCFTIIICFLGGGVFQYYESRVKNLTVTNDKLAVNYLFTKNIEFLFTDIKKITVSQSKKGTGWNRALYLNLHIAPNKKETIHLADFENATDIIDLLHARLNKSV